MFGPQAECVGGEEQQRISGGPGFLLPGPVGREGPLGLDVPRAHPDLFLPPCLPVGSGHTRPGGGGRADSPAAQTGAGELGPQQGSHCDVPTPRTDSAPQPGSDRAGKGPRIAGQVTAPPWASVSPAVQCQEPRGGGVGGCREPWPLGAPGSEGFSHLRRPTARPSAGTVSASEWLSAGAPGYGRDGAGGEGVSLLAQQRPSNSPESPSVTPADCSPAPSLAPPLRREPALVHWTVY